MKSFIERDNTIWKHNF